MHLPPKRWKNVGNAMEDQKGGVFDWRIINKDLV
jgi:hypothetical protein